MIACADLLRISLIALVFLLGACSNQQLYTAAQQHQQLECSKLPQSRFEECMREVEGSYRQYQRDRDTLVCEGKPVCTP